jgi:hypothetical protein
MAKRTQQGVAVLELAFILPLLLVMTFVVTEFGRAIYQYNTLTKSVRDAARYLSVQTPGTQMTQAKNLVVYGNTAGTGTPLALGLSVSHVPDPTWQASGSNPVISAVTIRISGYTFQSVFPSVFGLPLGAIPFSEIRATMRSQL